MAKIPKMTLATRNPVFCELIRGFLQSRCDLSAKNSDMQLAFHPHNEKLAVAAIRVSNPDCAPLGIHGSDPAQNSIRIL